MAGLIISKLLTDFFNEIDPFRTLETKFAVLHKAAFLQRCGRVRPLGLCAPSGDSREAPYSPLTNIHFVQ